MKLLTMLTLLLVTINPSQANEIDELKSKLKQLAQEIKKIEQQLANKQREQEQQKASAKDGIKLGGAVRFQYVYEDYSKQNTNRGGDLDFDIFRLDLNGTIGDITLSAQYRWFQYMDVVHHAWLGYQINKNWQTELGITRVPFGNLSYNSDNYFFSSNYYVGLEDDYDAGIKFIRKTDHHDLRLGYFFTDEMGGIDGYVDNRSDRYSYDLVGVRAPQEGIYDEPGIKVAEHNTFSLRYAYQFKHTELGFSFLQGDLRGENQSLGSRQAFAIHSQSQLDRWNIKLQYSQYDYDFDDNSPLIAVGAYSFYDTIPAEASLYTANVAYLYPVKIGPISSFNFYNNFNLMTDKSGDFKHDTLMNVTGVAISAGALYSYFDLVNAKNQPFVGGTMAGDSDDWQTRFNINFGYYF